MTFQAHTDQCTGETAITTQVVKFGEYGGPDAANTLLPVFAMIRSGAQLSCYMADELFNDPERLRAEIGFCLPLFKVEKMSRQQRAMNSRLPKFLTRSATWNPTLRSAKSW